MNLCGSCVGCRNRHTFSVMCRDNTELIILVSFVIITLISRALKQSFFTAKNFGIKNNVICAFLITVLCIMMYIS